MNIKIGVVDLRIVHFADLTADFTIEFIADRAFLQDTHQIAGIRHFFTQEIGFIQQPVFLYASGNRARHVNTSIAQVIEQHKFLIAASLFPTGEPVKIGH